MSGDEMARLIDIDKKIIVPITDETKGGIVYEAEMTVAEFFARFLPDYQPEIVDAIPVEWLREKIKEHTDDDDWQDYLANSFGLCIEEWQKEQEVRW